MGKFQIAAVILSAVVILSSSCGLAARGLEKAFAHGIEAVTAESAARTAEFTSIRGSSEAAAPSLSGRSLELADAPSAMTGTVLHYHPLPASGFKSIKALLAHHHLSGGDHFREITAAEFLSRAGGTAKVIAEDADYRIYHDAADSAVNLVQDLANNFYYSDDNQ